MKVGFSLFLVCFHRSDEDGAEIRGRHRCGGRRRLGHSNTLVTARDRERDREFV